MSHSLCFFAFFSNLLHSPVMLKDSVSFSFLTFNSLSCFLSSSILAHFLPFSPILFHSLPFSVTFSDLLSLSFTLSFLSHYILFFSLSLSSIFFIMSRCHSLSLILFHSLFLFSLILFDSVKLSFMLLYFFVAFIHIHSLSFSRTLCLLSVILFVIFSHVLLFSVFLSNSRSCSCILVANMSEIERIFVNLSVPFANFSEPVRI